MERYRFLEHTADAKMQAFGDSLEEAFANAGLGLFSIMFDAKDIKGKIEKNIEVEGNDRKALLYNWLEELLFLLDSESFVMKDVKMIEIGENTLKAEVIGDTMSGDYKSHGDVKAVTYNEMEITEVPGKVTVQVVFDL